MSSSGGRWLASVALGLGVMTGGPGLARAAPAETDPAPVEPERKSTTYVPAFWHKTQVWDFFRRAPQFGWSFDFFLRTQGAYDDPNLFRNRLRESYRVWFVWFINPLNRFSIAPISYHRDDGLRWNEASADGQVRHELRSSLELESNVFFHKRVMLSHRYRLEGRMFVGEGRTDPLYLARWRARLRLRFSLNNRSYYDHKALYAITYNEVGIHVGPSTPWAFNQNRAFLGLGYRVGYFTRLELGYVNQWRGGAGVPQYHSNHGPMLYIMVDYLSAEIATAKRRRNRRLARKAESEAR